MIGILKELSTRLLEIGLEEGDIPDKEVVEDLAPNDTDTKRNGLAVLPREGIESREEWIRRQKLNNGHDTIEDLRMSDGVASEVDQDGRHNNGTDDLAREDRVLEGIIYVHSRERLALYLRSGSA